jgi:hypothetical protein
MRTEAFEFGSGKKRAQGSRLTAKGKEKIEGERMRRSEGGRKKQVQEGPPPA